ncbi:MULTISPECIES: DUF1801 domain-containing protein [unclassified Mameliella]|uniref:DUF1801 domain-containing protein n=1 Tax=unclassified Mameliella TaxID=2630630 RepID=UPI00273E48E4|nr:MULTISPECIES: DUF1801 domain-containing protein [unclassified Mameliella]
MAAMMAPPPVEVADVVVGYPPAARAHFMQLRMVILDEAENLSVGPLTETLKWGEPAFLTAATGACTTLRLAWKPKVPEVLQLLVHCQTSLVTTWRDHFPELTAEGNRALHLPLAEPLPVSALRICIAGALSYHRR